MTYVQYALSRLSMPLGLAYTLFRMQLYSAEETRTNLSGGLHDLHDGGPDVLLGSWRAPASWFVSHWFLLRHESQECCLQKVIALPE